MKYPKSIQTLIDYLSNFPTVGPKTAERYVFYLLKANSEWLQRLAQAIAELKEKTSVCRLCLSVAESDPCPICADAGRDRTTICVVADWRDLIALEAGRHYRGLYHILGGVINAVEGIKPGELNIKPLLARLKAGKIKEVIIALNPDLEGETTTLYLAKLLKPYKIKITRLAKGLPMGAGLEYADEITLSNALKYRNELN